MGFDSDCILFIHSIVTQYFCAVCRTLVYPDEAQQAPCSHLYCKQCLLHIASSTKACPFDGQLVTEADSKPLVETDKSLAENIGKVLVRCNYHRSGCTWQGPLSECIVHRPQCAFGDYLMICIKCGIQMMHRETDDHAQICNVNVYPHVYYSQVVENYGQHPLTVQSSSGQVLCQITHPPFPLRPLEPPQRLPPHSPPCHPVLEFQQPMHQKLPHLSAGYASGHVQGQLLHTGGPPQLMQHPPFGNAQQHGVTLAHGMQPRFSQSYMGRPANGLGVNLNKLKPETEAKNQPRPENGPVNRFKHLHPPRPYDSSSFTFFPQYQLGGPFAPSSAAMLARGPSSSANHDKSFDSQIHIPPYRPSAVFSSLPPAPLHGRLRHLGEGFPNQHHSPGSELTRPHLDEPGFRTSYLRQGFPNGGPCREGGSDYSDNSRKRKTESMGWCRICQVDCESVEGLEKHNETHDHQLMSMDAVNNKRLKTSNAQSGLGEASEPGSTGSLGCGSKP